MRVTESVGERGHSKVFDYDVTMSTAGERIMFDFGPQIFLAWDGVREIGEPIVLTSYLDFSTDRSGGSPEVEHVEEWLAEVDEMNRHRLPDDLRDQFVERSTKISIGTIWTSWLGTWGRVDDAPAQPVESLETVPAQGVDVAGTVRVESLPVGVPGRVWMRWTLTIPLTPDVVALIPDVEASDEFPSSSELTTVIELVADPTSERPDVVSMTNRVTSATDPSINGEMGRSYVFDWERSDCA